MQQKHTLKDWLIATRPWSFTASGLTVLTALIYLWWLTGEVNWTNGVMAIVGIILFHASGNTWSDYHDYRSGVDTVEGAYAVQTLAGGFFAPKQVRNLSLGLLVVAVAVGLWLLWQSGWGLLWIGLGGLICTIGYPALKYRALGDFTILMAYGFLPAIGTSYVAVGEVDWRVLWVALPIGLLVDSILHANNTRDMATDGKAGIRTMAHGLGLRASAALYVFEVLFPFVWVVVLVPFGIFPLWSLLLVLVMRVAMGLSRTMREYKESGKIELIAPLDQRSAALQMLFCLVMIVSLVVDCLLR
jgi:1,4-dihydroxy-2-naphthoate octaprenyltransferase